LIQKIKPLNVECIVVPVAANLMPKQHNNNFWTPDRIALLGTDFDPVIAKRLGITKHKVYLQRRRLGIKPLEIPCKWGETELALLRSHTDQEVAKMTGRSVTEVAAKRLSL
jgi:hypothetical protein